MAFQSLKNIGQFICLSIYKPNPFQTLVFKDVLICV